MAIFALFRAFQQLDFEQPSQTVRHGGWDHPTVRLLVSFRLY